MINQLFLYCYSIYAGLSHCNQSRLQTLQKLLYQLNDPLTGILLKHKESNVWLLMYINVCITSTCKKIMKTLANFVNHQKNTRNNGSLVRLPTVKTEAGRKTSIYQGGLAFKS